MQDQKFKLQENREGYRILELQVQISQLLLCERVPFQFMEFLQYAQGEKSHLVFLVMLSL